MDWVAVGLCGDVPAGTVVPRRVFNTDLAVWCSAGGKYHVWGDRCPHRGMRLSHGFVRGENLACIYHGWQYDGDGACSYIPAHPNLAPPKTICVNSYDCRVQGNAIWVTLSEASSSIPDVGDRKPVRTLDVSLSAEAVAKKMGQTLSELFVLGGEHDLAIAPQPSSPDSCLLHVFAGSNQDPKEVSRHIERKRIELESDA